MITINKIALPLIAATMLLACVETTSNTNEQTIDVAKENNASGSLTVTEGLSQEMVNSYNSINTEQLIEHVKILSSDKFGGRAPSSVGETLTLEYLTEQFKALGFKPGNGDSFLQAVPLVSIEASSDMTLDIGGKSYQY
jgi:hypothetical protein